MDSSSPDRLKPKTVSFLVLGYHSQLTKFFKSMTLRFKSPLVEDLEPTRPKKPSSKKQKAPKKAPRVEWREFNPGQLSSLYPWYFGPPTEEVPQASQSKPSPRKGRSRAGNDVVMVDIPDEDHDTDDTPVEVDDDATIADEEQYTDIKLNRLPVGLKVDDIQDQHERTHFEERMAMASSTAVLAKGLDTEQLMLFLEEVKVCLDFTSIA